MTRYVQEVSENGRWSRWIQPRRRGYKLMCCGCSLVHDMEFRAVTSANGGRSVQYRIALNNRATAAARRSKR